MSHPELLWCILSVQFVQGDFLDDDQETPFVGHLGHGEEWGEAVARPTAVRLPAAVRAHSVAAGGYMSMVLSEEGREAWSWLGL